MLKSLTIDRWTHVFPVIRFFTQLESLSLVFVDGLGTSAANIITRHLPKLRTFSVVQADESHAQELASFLSNLKADQLRSFSCSLNRTQAPILQALSKQTFLQDLALQFLVSPPLELRKLFKLTNLTSLRLGLSFSPSSFAQSRFKDWVTNNRGTFATWLISCENLRGLHIFRFPDLIPAIADALRHLRLNRLHVFSTGYYGDFYRALETQQLEYLFVAECPDREIISHSLGWRERGGHVMTAVLAMPCLRDLRLHTYFPLGYRELEHIAIYVPRLETISFVCRQGENPTWTLRALENFKHLTGLTVLGLTVFSSRDMLRWIEWTQCHLRPGGFSLSLPTQDRRSWFRGVGVSDYTYINDPATERIKQMLRFFALYVRDRSGHGEVWRGNDYEFDEERMFVHLWDDIRGPAEALQLLRGSGPYPPFMGLMENMGTRIV